MTRTAGSVAREQRRALARENGVPMPPPDPTPGLQLGPVPVSTNVAVVDTPDGGLVVLTVTTPIGIAGYFLSPDHAKALAGHLAQYAASAATGLQIIGDAHITPDDVA